MAVMNWFMLAAVGLLACYVPCCLTASRRRTMDRIAGLQAAVIISVLEIMVMSEALSQPSFIDLALAMALLSFPATLVFAYIMERWL